MVGEERIDLEKYLINKDNPDRTPEWCACQQLEALRFYLSDEVEILAQYKEDYFHGVCFATMRVKNKIILWRDSFGSCPGGYHLDSSNGYKYIKLTLQEEYTQQFNTIDEAKEYIKTTKDYPWENNKNQILVELFGKK